MCFNFVRCRTEFFYIYNIYIAVWRIFKSIRLIGLVGLYPITRSMPLTRILFELNNFSLMTLFWFYQLYLSFSPTSISLLNYHMVGSCDIKLLFCWNCIEISALNFCLVFPNLFFSIYLPHFLGTFFCFVTFQPTYKTYLPKLVI